MEFDWSKRTIGEWRNLLAKVDKANWMQTWPYAQASFKRDRFSTRLATLKKNGVDLAIIAIQEIKLGPLHLINLNRGPLWLIQNPTEDLFLEFAQLFRKTFPKSRFQRLRWMPNWIMTPQTKDRLNEIGFKERPEYFMTAWLDLKKPIEQIRSELKQKWRNGLNKSEKSTLKIVMETSPSRLEFFLEFYSRYKAQKKFQGPSSAFLKEEFLNAFIAGDGFLLWAFQNNHPVAGIGLVKHGHTATYRMGWNSNLGRQSNAHYALIWKSILMLKNLNIESFDLGGLKPDEASGLTHFKEGLSGEVQLYKIFGN